MAKRALTVNMTNAITKKVAYLRVLFIQDSCYLLIKLFTGHTSKYHMRFCIFLAILLLIAIPARAQHKSPVVTAMGSCLSVLDIKLKAQMLSQDNSNNLPFVVLKNTISIYKQIIQHTMPSDMQMEIVVSYLAITQEINSALMIAQDQDLDELVADINSIAQQCVDKVSYQPGQTK